jgi:hypothetical protein
LPFTDGFYPLLLVAFALFALCVMCILKRCLCASTSRTAGAGGDGGKKTAAGLMAGLLGGSVDRKVMLYLYNI